MSKLMREATVAEMNAAFDAVYDELHDLIEEFVPSFFKAQARAKIESPEGRKKVLTMVDAALDAAQSVREANESKT